MSYKIIDLHHPRQNISIYSRSGPTEYEDSFKEGVYEVEVPELCRLWPWSYGSGFSLRIMHRNGLSRSSNFCVGVFAASSDNEVTWLCH